MGSADSTAEQQLHTMEAAQNTYVASHFPDLWSNPLLVVLWSKRVPSSSEGHWWKASEKIMLLG